MTFFFPQRLPSYYVSQSILNQLLIYIEQNDDTIVLQAHVI